MAKLILIDDFWSKHQHILQSKDHIQINSVSEGPKMFAKDKIKKRKPKTIAKISLIICWHQRRMGKQMWINNLWIEGPIYFVIERPKPYEWRTQKIIKKRFFHRRTNSQFWNNFQIKFDAFGLKSGGTDLNWQPQTFPIKDQNLTKWGPKDDQKVTFLWSKDQTYMIHASMYDAYF